jgi:exonuclease VII small subunit
MFVLKKTFDKKVEQFKDHIKQLQSDCASYKDAYDFAYKTALELKDHAQKLLNENASLKITIAYLQNKQQDNRKGFSFSQDEIKTLISLCHPDKHNNSDRANLITQRLLELRRK